MQIYLGNLAPEVDEALLLEFLRALAPAHSVRMPRKASRSQGYAFATFSDPKDGEYVLDLLEHTPISLFRHTLKARPAARDRPAKPEYVPKIYVGNLAPEAALDTVNLTVPFSKFGEVKGVEFAHGHALVQMKTLEDTRRAIEGLNQQTIMNRKVSVRLE